jgi:hypothetical protein
MQERINTAAGNAAWGGIVLSILGNISWQNLTHTIIMAIIRYGSKFLYDCPA